MSNGNSGPVGIPGRPIHERQHDPEMVTLQRASASVNRQGQYIEALRNTVTLAIAVGGLVLTIVDVGRGVLAVVAFLWFFFSNYLKLKAAAVARAGALIQEKFDTELFYLPWPQVLAGDPVSDADVRRFARTLKGAQRLKRITDGWYDPTDGVRYPYDVLIAQEQNLGWDARLRRTYGQWIAILATVWMVLGIILAVALKAQIPEILLSFYIPSLPALQLAWEIWTGQRRVAAERERLGRLVQTSLRDARPGSISDADRRRRRGTACDIQTGIFLTRVDVARVPEWLYRLLRPADEQDFADTAEGHRLRLADPGRTVTPP